MATIFGTSSSINSQEWADASAMLIASLHQREYQKALIRVPIIPIVFLAFWGLAVYFLQSSLRVDLAAVLRTPGAVAGLAADASAEDRFGSASPASNNKVFTPKHIMASALLLFAALMWCVFVWCGLLSGELEGALLAFFCVLPLVLVMLPMDVCRPRCTLRRPGLPTQARDGNANGSDSLLEAPSCDGLAGCFLCSNTMRRVFWPSSRAVPPFLEVLMADALCSLSKVFADAGLVVAVLLKRLLVSYPALLSPLSFATSSSSGSDVDSLSGGNSSNGSSGLDLPSTLSLVLPPLLASLPYLLRMQQLSVNLRRGDARDRPLHWINMAKYAFNLPAIWFAAMLASVPPASALTLGTTRALLFDVAVDRHALEQVVLLLGAASGLFSFCWDVHMDWGLNACVQVPTPHGRKTSIGGMDGDLSSLGGSSSSSGEKVGLLVEGSEKALKSGSEPSPQVLPIASSLALSIDSKKSASSSASSSLKRPSIDSSESLLLGNGHSSSTGSSGDDEGNNGGSATSRRSPRRGTSAPPCGLRDTLLFRSRWVYYVAMLLNLGGRLAGAILGLTDIPAVAKLRGIDLALLLQGLEVARRAGWAVLRVEWEVVKTSAVNGLSDRSGHGRHV